METDMSSNRDTDREAVFVSAVVYVHDAAETAAGFLTRLAAILAARFEHFEIICVNDASRDDSAAAIKAAAAAIDRAGGVLSLVTMSHCHGLEASMRAGVDLAIGDFVYEFDEIIMDYPEALITGVYEKTVSGYDIVSAGVTPRRRPLTSRLFYAVFNRASGFPAKLTTETFRLLSRRAINRVQGMSRSIPYRKAVYANCGLKTAALTYTPVTPAAPRAAPRAAISRERARAGAAVNAFILFTDLGYKIAAAISLLMMLATLATGVYTAVIYALGIPIPGFTATMLVLTGAFFAVFLLLAIIIKYLSVILDLVFKERRYLIESIEKVSP